MATKLLQKKTNSIYNRFKAVQKANLKVEARKQRVQQELNDFLQVLIDKYCTKTHSTELIVDPAMELCNEGKWNKLTFSKNNEGVYTTIFNFTDETQEPLQNITIDKMELARYMTNIVKTLYNE